MKSTELHKIFGSGSSGNAVLYHGEILVDIGTSMFSLREYEKDIKIVLLTHEHKDHFVYSVLQKLMSMRPTLRVGCCEWMLPHVKGINNVDVYEIGKLYDYGSFQISPIKLYHDVPNCGYRIFKGNHKTIHATDSAHLEGITAKDYDLYAIEANYDEETVWESIARIESAGGFAHQRGSMNTHLSIQQAREFIYKNRKLESVVIRLHESSTV